MKVTLLKYLNLNKNQIGYKGMKYLKLMTIPLLEILYLEDNNIMDIGMKYLTHMNIKYIRKISILNNKITDKGKKKYLSRIRYEYIEHINSVENIKNDPILNYKFS